MKTKSDSAPSQVIRKQAKKAEQLRRKVCRKAKRMSV